MICRLCLIHLTRKNSVDLFENETTATEFVEMISKFFQLQMTKQDEISTKICKKCSAHLKEFHQYWLDVDKKQAELYALKCKIEEKKIAETSLQEPHEINELYNFTTEFIKLEEPMAIGEISIVNNNIDDAYHGDVLDKQSNSEDDHSAASAWSPCDDDDDFTSEDDIPLIKTRNSKSQRKSTNFKGKQKTVIDHYHGENTEAKDKEKDNEFLDINCGLCKIALQTFNHLEDHFKNKHKSQRRAFVKCCGKKFFAPDQIDRHKRLHNVTCEICKKTFNRKSYLNYHMKALHEGADVDGKHQCKICDKLLRSPKYLKNHMRLHDKDSKASCVCEVCSKIYTTPEALRRHFRAAHEQINTFKCLRCNENFYFKSSLEDHEFQCKQRAANNETSAEPIEDTSTNDNQSEQKEEDDKTKFSHICDRCFKGFSDANRLRRHVEAVHENVFRHICDQCGKKFKSKNIFERHLRKHEGIVEPPAQCEVCGSWLKNKESLRLHMYRHDNADSQCRICGRTCPNRGALRRHVDRMHRPEKNYKCNYCASSFKLEISLKEHMAIHTNTQLYTCPHCPKESRSHSNMYVHIKRMHPNEWMQTRLARLHRPQFNAANELKKEVQNTEIDNGNPNLQIT